MSDFMNEFQKLETNQEKYKLFIFYLYQKKNELPILVQDSQIEDRDEMFPLFYDLCSGPVQTIEEVSIKDIRSGNNLNWFFDKRVEERGNYPQNKIENIMKGILLGKDELPPIELIYVDGHYYLGEGNHRLYVYTLLGYSTVTAKVERYEGYEEAIRKIDFSKYKDAVIFNNTVYPVSQKMLSDLKRAFYRYQ